MSTFYSEALQALLHLKQQLNIVIIGANDGKINDPIYPFIMEHSNDTNVLLIEPNTDVIPYLEENYVNHPSHRVANCAIGEEGTLTLYAIKKSAWSRYLPSYSKGIWPVYRAATGITSVYREHIEKHLEKENIDSDDMIKAINVPSKNLSNLIQELNWSPKVDVLQIDAEGFDDQVIYASNIEQINADLIHFESMHLDEIKNRKLHDFLLEADYEVYDRYGSAVAIRESNPTLLKLSQAHF